MKLNRLYFRGVLLPVTISTVILSSCGFNNDYIKQREWKYDEGFRIRHDLIAFGGIYINLRNDTVFVLDTAVATIFRKEKTFLGYNKIHIKSLRTNETGVYTDFDSVKSQDTTIEITLTPPPATEDPVPPLPPPPKNR